MNDTSTDSTGAFLSEVVVNSTRLMLMLGGTVLILLCIRVAYLRARSGREDALRDVSPWILLSSAAFAAIPTGSGFLRFNEPFVPWKVALYVVALICGFIALWPIIDLYGISGRTPRLRPKNRYAPTPKANPVTDDEDGDGGLW